VAKTETNGTLAREAAEMLIKILGFGLEQKEMDDWTATLSNDELKRACAALEALSGIVPRLQNYLLVKYLCRVKEGKAELPANLAAMLGGLV
jgi:hypothetical protein